MKKSNDIFAEFTVGVFMLAVMALLVYFTIVISGVDFLHGRERVRVSAVFDDVGGLKERDNVMYRGMKVGTVETIELDGGATRVVLNVDRDVVMRETGTMRIASLSLLGGNYLLLEEGKGEIRPLEKTVFRGETPSDWMRDLGEVARNLNNLTGGDEVRSILHNASNAVAKANAIVDRVARGEGTLGRILSPDETLYNDIASTMSSASEAAASIKSVSAKLDSGQGALGKLISGGDEVYADLSRTLADASALMASLKAISQKVESGEGTVGKLVCSNEAYGDLKTTLENAAAASASLKSIAARLDAGEGIAGRLLAADDGGVWDDATASVRDLREILAEAKGSVADVKAAISNIKTFTERLNRDDSLVGCLTGDPELARNAEELVANLRAFSETLSKNEGTLGKLLTDPALHDDISGLVKDIRQIIDNYRDTTPITTFGSLATGAL